MKVFSVSLSILFKQPPEIFCKISCFWKFNKIIKWTPMSESFFNKVVGLRSTTSSKKRDSDKGTFLEFRKIFKNTFFTEHVSVTVSVGMNKLNYSTFLRSFQEFIRILVRTVTILKNVFWSILTIIFLRFCKIYSKLY